jgi:hypothetical protein
MRTHARTAVGTSGKGDRMTEFMVGRSWLLEMPLSTCGLQGLCVHSLRILVWGQVTVHGVGKVGWTASLPWHQAPGVVPLFPRYPQD